MKMPEKPPFTSVALLRPRLASLIWAGPQGPRLHPVLALRDDLLAGCKTLGDDRAAIGGEPYGNVLPHGLAGAIDHIDVKAVRPVLHRLVGNDDDIGKSVHQHSGGDRQTRPQGVV